ncbi:MAG: SigB/SigF/SigG family RNA polymerase sigma factor [Candidatus Margulisbacteria bacterium]|nr:SigB/SigF/SigG family RNA polymerase sigma factor [Candidatus Margulisiibacteriota bacterium]
MSKENLVLQYSKEKEREIKTPNLREDIVTAYSKLVEHIARRLAFRKDDFEDLRQVGNIGLLKALEQYDPTKEATFTTFATTNVIGEIKHYLRDKGGLVKIPRRLQELYSKINQAIRTLTQVKGRYPTIQEIADKLDLSPEEILESMEAGHSSQVISLDKTFYTSSKQNSSQSFSLLDSLGDNAHADEILNKESLKQALKKLTERERRIIYLRYFEGLTQKEIADCMHLSQMHISRILQGTLEKLKNKIGTK